MATEKLIVSYWLNFVLNYITHDPQFQPLCPCSCQVECLMWPLVKLSPKFNDIGCQVAESIVHTKFFFKIKANVVERMER